MKKHILLLLIYFEVGLISGQTIYPADSLLADTDVSLFKKMAILPIAGWQRISYNTNFLNCQFYPSCSNYGVKAIHDHGLIQGSIMASDRIVRCNPAAYYYHLKANMDINSFGYLVDPVTPETTLESGKKKSPFIAAGLSTIVPGLGRAYCGRIYEGLLGGLMTFLVGQIAWEAHHEKRPIKAPIFSSLFAVYYGGEIYGAYRTAKYYNPIQIQKEKP